MKRDSLWPDVVVFVVTMLAVAFHLAGCGSVTAAAPDGGDAVGGRGAGGAGGEVGGRGGAQLGGDGGGQAAGSGGQAGTGGSSGSAGGPDGGTGGVGAACCAQCGTSATSAGCRACPANPDGGTMPVVLGCGPQGFQFCCYFNPDGSNHCDGKSGPPLCGL